MRKNIVAGNWKMNKTLQEGVQLIKEIKELSVKEINNLNVQVIIIPPFTHLSTAKDLLKDKTSIHLGAQNCHHEEQGAFTGEVSASMLSSLGVEYVIIGHSERRAYFHETNELLAKKIKLALNHNLIPIYCCGETLVQRQNETYFDVVDEQINEGLFHLAKEELQKIIIAYEPVWAIGTGLNASPEEAQEMHRHIREFIGKGYGKDVASETTILYGGSCNASNASALFVKEDVDGGLIGGASLKSKDFMDIVKAIMNK
jgi:triosephosphate isomerase